MAEVFHRVLAIETSCDDSSVAIVDSMGRVEAICSAHQDLVHAPFGGVVPEVASRQHTEWILPLVEQTLTKAKRQWSEISGIAVTSRPGLIGSLMVGVVTAKSLGLAKGLPVIDVNHIEGHLVAPLLRDGEYSPPDGFQFPYLALVISGGHTHLFSAEAFGRYRLLGQTVDDAAGEAFDKFAKLVGLGYPGGAKVDQAARLGRRDAYDFPRSMIRDESLNFSFSGLKAAAQRMIQGWPRDQLQAELNNLCASYQEAIVDVLLSKLERAARLIRAQRLALTGGVSANSSLRERATELARRSQWALAIPPLSYCTDNAAMIGLAGIWRLQSGKRASSDFGPSAASDPLDFLKA